MSDSGLTNAEWNKQQNINQGVVRHLDELLATGASLDSRSDAGVVDALVTADVNQHLAKFNIGGIDVAPADAAARVRAELERRHDELLAADLWQFTRDLDATERSLEQRIADSRRPPKTENDLRELVLYRRFEGRTLADVVKAYEHATDADDPVFTRMVESDVSDLTRVFRLKPDADGDVPALQRLQASIAARMAARQDVTAVQHLAQLREWRGRQFRFSHLVDQVRQGRPVEVARLKRSHG